MELVVIVLILGFSGIMCNNSTWHKNNYMKNHKTVWGKRVIYRLQNKRDKINRLEQEKQMKVVKCMAVKKDNSLLLH